MGKGRSWSKEQEAILVEFKNAGKSARQAAELMGWSVKTTKKAWTKIGKGQKLTGNYKGRTSKLGPEAMAYARACFGEHKSLSTAKRGIKAEFDIDIHLSCLSRCAAKMGLKSVRKTRAQKISEQNKTRRLEFCRLMLARLKIGDRRIRFRGKTVKGLRLENIVWVDEKVFRQAPNLCTQNHRAWIKADKSSRPVTSKHKMLKTVSGEPLRLNRSFSISPGVMVASGLGLSVGVLPPTIVDKGVKVDGNKRPFRLPCSCGCPPLLSSHLPSPPSFLRTLSH